MNNHCLVVSLNVCPKTVIGSSGSHSILMVVNFLFNVCQKEQGSSICKEVCG